MKTKKESLWQELMNQVYERWNNKLKGISYEALLDSCTRQERVAVLLGNLNYQVNNGGFLQWVENGYGLHIREVMTILRDVKNPITDEIAENLADLKPYLNLKSSNKGFFGNYWKETQASRYDDIEEDRPMEMMEEMDDYFYDVGDEFMEIIEKYITSI